MMESLRPSTLGEILDRTANIYRTRFLVFLAIALLPASVMLVGAVAFVLFLTWAGTAGRSAGPTAVGIAAILFFGVGTLVFLPLGVAVAGLGTGALNHAAAAAFENQEITSRGAYSAAWKRGWRYIGLLALEGLILVVAPGVAWTAFLVVFVISQTLTGRSGSGSDAAGTAAVFLSMTLAGLYFVWMLLRLCLCFPASVVENIGAGAAIKRAIFLSNGTRWRILVLYVLGMILRFGISAVLIVPMILIIRLIPGLNTPQHTRIVGSVMMVLFYGSGFVIRTLIKPIYTIAEVVFYYDQRIRKEGFDIEWMMRQAGMVPAPVSAAAAVPWIPPFMAAQNATPESAHAFSVGIVPAAQAEQTAGSEEPPPISAIETLPPDAAPIPGEPA